MNKALFLDRDGVINDDHGHVGRIEQFQFVRGIFALCRHAQRLGYRLIVVTNQAGIAKALYTEAQFIRLARWMLGEFAQRGVSISAVYYCPTHPQAVRAAYRGESANRKPAPGMLLEAIRDFALDPAQCVLVGDKHTDLIAGRSAGVGGLFLFGTHRDELTRCPRGSVAITQLSQLQRHLSHSNTAPDTRLR